MSLKIIAGRSLPEFSAEVAKNLNADFYQIPDKTFEDKELNIKWPCFTEKDIVIIIQSTCPPVHDHLIELLFLINAAKRANVAFIGAVVPYFGYGRQDDHFGTAPAPLAITASLLQCVGLQCLITVAPHSTFFKDFFSIPVYTINPFSLFKPIEQCILVSPDEGGIARVCDLAEQWEQPWTFCKKIRHINDRCQIIGLQGSVAGKICVLVDDIINTADTICQAAEMLLNNNAQSVYAYCVHGIFSGNAFENLEKSSIQNVIISDTVRCFNIIPKLTQISTVPIVVKTLESIFFS